MEARRQNNSINLPHPINTQAKLTLSLWAVYQYCKYWISVALASEKRGRKEKKQRSKELLPPPPPPRQKKSKKKQGSLDPDPDNAQSPRKSIRAFNLLFSRRGLRKGFFPGTKRCYGRSVFGLAVWKVTDGTDGTNGRGKWMERWITWILNPGCLDVEE